MTITDRFPRSIAFRRQQRAGITAIAAPLLEWMPSANAGCSTTATAT